jgi:phenol hydroxylase P4 protein
MSVTAIGDYPAIVKDGIENFHGNTMVIIGWDQHVMVSSPMAFPLPAGMPFGALVAEVIPAAYGPDPDFGSIEWDKVSWLLDDAPFTPDMEKSLDENGIGHKSVLRFKTPGLDSLAPR